MSRINYQVIRASKHEKSVIMSSLLKSNLADNLKKLMEKANISEHELSRKTKVAQPIINRILNGENLNPKLLTLKPLADYFIITVSQLIGEQDIQNTWEGYTNSNHDGWSEVPIKNWKKAAIVNPSVRKSILNESVVTNTAFGIYILNDEMEPLVPKNSVVIVEPSIKPMPGDLIALKSKSNNTIIRNYFNIKNQHFIISSRNKEKLREIENPELAILGTVIRIIYDPRIKT